MPQQQVVKENDLKGACTIHQTNGSVVQKTGQETFWTKEGYYRPNHIARHNDKTVRACIKYYLLSNMSRIWPKYGNIQTGQYFVLYHLPGIIQALQICQEASICQFINFVSYKHVISTIRKVFYRDSARCRNGGEIASFSGCPYMYTWRLENYLDINLSNQLETIRTNWNTSARILKYGWGGGRLLGEVWQML